MTNLEISAKLMQLLPGAHWVLTGDTYDGLIWLDDASTKPTAAQLGL